MSKREVTNVNSVKRCSKCGGTMINEALEWRCTKCGYTQCIEPEYCPPSQNKKKE